MLRLTCASAEAMFIFSIDGHNLTVIANDLVPIQPYTTKSLFIGIGKYYPRMSFGMQLTIVTQVNAMM